MSSSLAGHVALVTGASRGIGRAIALELAQHGACVAVHYGRHKDGADEVVRAIEAADGKAFAIGADLARVAAIETLFEQLDRELSQRGLPTLSILVNNAGIGGGGSLSQTTEEMFDKLFATNVRSVFFVAQKAVPRLRDGGRIINLSSMVAFAAYPNSMAYAMTKAAVNSFTRSLAVQLGPRGITVNAVAPGATATDFIKAITDQPELAKFYASAATLGRLGQPQDIAGVVSFLASPAGAWITGQVIQASGGMHL